LELVNGAVGIMLVGEAAGLLRLTDAGKHMRA
jgi:hypothetical protein